MPTARPDAVPLDDLLADREWVRSLARSLTPDAHRAEDLEQRTWLAALRRPPNDPAASRGWLGRVTRNLARDLWRGEMRRAAREQTVARRRGEAPSTDELAARAEIHRRLIRAVLALREPYQTTVLLRFFDGLEPGEIARRAGVAPATVRSRLHRALAELRGQLERDGTHERAIWLLALPASESTASSAPLGAAWGKSLGGGLAMTAKKKLLAAAVVLAALSGTGWWLANGTLGGADGAEPGAGADVAAGKADEQPDAASRPGPGTARRPRERSGAAETAESGADEGAAAAAGSDPVATEEGTAEEEAATAAPSQRAPDDEALTVHFRRFVPPLEVPEGYTEIESLDDIPEITGPGPGSGRMPRGPRPLPYWSRWPFPPKKGNVTLEGRVVDASGAPIEGAQVYRIDIGKYADPGPVLSFQYIDELVKTDRDGRFRATDVIAGEMLIWADFQRQLVAPMGLRVEGALSANPSENETLESLELRLPFEVGRLGAIEGVVTDWQGKPAHRASVIVGRQREFTDLQGRFRLIGISAGDTTVGVELLGHVSQSVPVTVEEAGTTAIDVDLVLASDGKLHFAGRVVDSFGDPVRDTPLFLGTGRYQDQRRGRTDEEGRFRFERLPDSLSEGVVSLSLMVNPDSGTLIGRTERGLKVPQDGYEFVVQRAVLVNLRYVSKLTGERLPQIKYDLRAAVDETGENFARGGRSGGRYTESGEAEMTLAPGLYLLTARARGHRGMEVTFEIPATPGRKVVVLEFQPE